MRWCAVLLVAATSGSQISLRAQPGHENDTKAPPVVSDWRIAFSLPTGARPDKMIFSPDGRFLFVLLGKQLQKWEIKTRRQLWIHREPNDVSDFALDPTGTTLAFATSPSVSLCAASTGERIATLPVVAYAVAFSRDGKWLATAGDNGHLTGKLPTRVAVALWGNGDWKRCATMLAPLQNGFETLKESFQATALDFSPDGRRIVVTTTTSILLEFDIAGKLIERPWGRPSNFIRFAPDGKTAIGRLEIVVTSESSNYTLSLYDPKNWTIRDSPHYPRNNSASTNGEIVGANAIAYTPDSQTIAAAFADGFLGLFDTQTGKLKTTLARAQNKYWSTPLAFSPDSKQLASGFWKQVDFWQKGP